MNRPCDVFGLQLKVGDSPSHEGAKQLYAEIWINGQHIDEPHFLDLPLVVQSLHEEGWFEIFTCSCGFGSCAGIVNGIRVIHDRQYIHWYFRRPQAADNCFEEEAWERWQSTAVPVAFTFERNQMLVAIKVYLGLIRKIVANDPSLFDWPVCGLTVEEVLEIDPEKPFYPLEDGE